MDANAQDRPVAETSAAPSVPALTTTRPTSGHTSLDAARDAHQEYLDSLAVPSPDELARIAAVQAEREAKLRRQSREVRQRSSSHAAETATDSTGALSVPVVAASHGRTLSLSQRLGLTKARAAVIIQRHYRGYRTRRELKGLGIDADTRWVHAIREVRYREWTRPRPRAETADSASLFSMGSTGAESNARSYWKKAAMVARRAGFDPDSDTESDSDSESNAGSDAHSSSDKSDRKKRAAAARAKRRAEARMMGLQYFLEMVDVKHRYGANLRVYHEEWKRTDTYENFFVWLDHGDGRLVDMVACPRDRLEREQVRYLSREERQYYLATVDDEGRLCWAKNGARIDTTERWKDSVHGIVPADDPTPAYRPAAAHDTTKLLGSHGDDSASSSDSESSVAESELEAARAAKYAPAATKKIHHISPAAVFDALLRKSVQKNTWIFVADTSFRLYVGIKDSGAFQHSSFLQGSRISAAGLIKIRNGRLAALSPLSGHYRPPAANFRAFTRSLKEAGVDMSHVSISKSYAVLVGLETYMKTRQRGKDLLKRIGQHGRSRSEADEILDKTAATTKAAEGTAR